MILGWAIILLIGVAFLHFILDSIISPSEQMITRISLVRAADRLEYLKERQAVGGKDRAAISLLRSCVHNFINNAPRWTISTIAELKMKLRDDEKFRKESKGRISVLESCMSDDVREVNDAVSDLADRTLMLNSLGWFIYMVPIVACVVMLGSIKAAIKTLLTTPPAKLHSFDEQSAFC